jgi:hypothetical protein
MQDVAVWVYAERDFEQRRVNPSYLKAGRQKNMAEPKPKNPKPKTQNSKLRTQNSKLKTQNPKLRTQNSKLKTQNP